MLTGMVQLGGRQFACVNYEHIIVLNEHYVMKLMRATGLDTVMPQTKESDEQYYVRLYARMVDTLKLPDLLAGYLLPNGKTEADWTLELAGETAAFICKLSKPEDKAEVHRLGMAVTLDFFAAGLASLRASRNLMAAKSQSPAESEASSAGA